MASLLSMWVWGGRAVGPAGRGVKKTFNTEIDKVRLKPQTSASSITPIDILIYCHLHCQRLSCVSACGAATQAEPNALVRGSSAGETGTGSLPAMRPGRACSLFQKSGFGFRMSGPRHGLSSWGRSIPVDPPGTPAGQAPAGC